METTRIGPVGETVDTPRHRALGSASRVAILRLARAAPGGVTIADVAAETGLHLSTVRAHLDRLVEAGLLVKARGGAGAPGRPAWRYRAAAPDPAPGSYRGLAAALLDHLGTDTGDGRSAAARVGEAWGRRLAAEEPGTAPADGLLRVLDWLGFAPVSAAPAPGGAAGAAAAEVHLRACPFLDLVADNPEVMCGLHLGVVRGVLAELGSAAVDAATLEPFGAPAACVVRVPAEPGPDRTVPRRDTRSA
ncbi:MAG TPA: helix-turn-helix domain-containing protein [Micromonosporaceae bacterium]|nr:helix-turn-helix domain-containing protein [Micromonosporaceae bacterium]